MPPSPEVPPVAHCVALVGGIQSFRVSDAVPAKEI